VTRAQLEHILRAASTIAEDDEIIVIGSHPILGQFPNAPEELLVSNEADALRRQAFSARGSRRDAEGVEARAGRSRCSAVSRIARRADAAARRDRARALDGRRERGGAQVSARSVGHRGLARRERHAPVVG
jgi:hypothetical protein